MGNMNVGEAVITAKKIGARLNIPDHFDMFASNMENPAKFTCEFAENEVFLPEFDRQYKVLVENSAVVLK
jgi:L-ascorbate metabolism protein UlaG (beta-lactamase superfamily)